MPSLSGSLIDVTSAPSDATEVWIRAADGRVSGANVVLEETRRVPVTGGKFTVTVLPGRAHLVVIHAGMSQEHVPLLVQDGMTTIAEAVRLGAADWEEYSPSQAEQIKAEIAAEVAKAATSAQAAKNAQQAAEKARTDTQNALSTKADKVHTHALGDVTGLQAALNGKASTSHTHTTAQVTGLDSALASKAAQADMVALQQKLEALTTTETVKINDQVQVWRRAGIVTLRLLKATKDQATAATIPVGYRPKIFVETLIKSDADVKTTVGVKPDGSISIYKSSVGTTLNGIITYMT